MTRRELALTLALTQGIGGKTVTRVLARNDLLSRSPEEFLRLSPESLREEYRLTEKVAKAVSQVGVSFPTEIREMERRLDGLGVILMTAADAQYPPGLEEMDEDPPGVLFLYGNQRILHGKTFCVLSSRNSHPAALDQVESLTEEGVLSGEVLVSGHNRPEYQRSAIVPLRWGAPRILCLDQGLFSALGEDLKEEPFRSARLWRYQFDPVTDLVVTPFRPESHFSGVNNKVRDRLVAGLSARLDFVDIQVGGNMERLARQALRAGRRVRVSDRSISYRTFQEAGAQIISA